jgi:NADH-quinone oxidoreductase subunit G
VGALTSKDFRFKMRVWFLKETKSVCTSCAMGCNTLIGSREGVIHRLTPRDNPAVNQSWMCDFGRLNYKWIGGENRLREVSSQKAEVGGWTAALKAIANRLRAASQGSVGLIASARLANEELYLLSLLAQHLGAVTDSVPHAGDHDEFLVKADKNPNSSGARLLGLAADPLGSRLTAIADGIRAGAIQTLLVFGEDVTACGIGAELLARLETLVASDVLPSATTAAAHFVLPGCAAAEKRGSFINLNGQVQRFLKAIEPPGDARPEAEFFAELVTALTGRKLPVTMEGLFNEMAANVPAFAGLTWSELGDTGRAVPL